MLFYTIAFFAAFVACCPSKHQNKKNIKPPVATNTTPSTSYRREVTTSETRSKSAPSIPLPQTFQPQIRVEKKPKPEKAMFGHYECQRCHKKWTSSHSWKDYGQQCLRCKEYVKPSLLYPKQPKLDFSFECSMCSYKFSICEADERYEHQPLLQTKENAMCESCNKKNGKIVPEMIRINGHGDAECIGKCRHCTTDIVLSKKHLSSPITTICKSCTSNHCFLKTVKKIQIDLTQKHRQDMCEKCQKEGKYCGRL